MLATADPATGDILPADDASWERGDLKPNYEWDDLHDLLKQHIFWDKFSDMSLMSLEMTLSTCKKPHN
ncbi:uncharacterized protein Triagg1_1646 [Trichoderma aggressivum f. europaeum]|uniref:Uncharacterized protein n=1 Tax=Trichoderma aggressivum f. europaeum TaxID=173218 RepID=A0AAE1M257_9HYPO|nr:hypothetical protein Triagg1_1646 [Trichoderma aggressivum f. europaeum]